MDRETWHAAVHGVAKNRTRLSDRTQLNFFEKTVASQCSQQHYSQQPGHGSKPTQPSIYKWIKKVQYVYNRILLNHKEE